MRDLTPWTGTWTLDPSASTFAAGGLASEGTLSMVQDGKALELRTRHQLRGTTVVDETLRVVPDGRPVELEDGSAMVATLDPLGFVTASRRGHRVEHLAHRTLLDDGSTLRVVLEGLTEAGRPWRAVHVYRR